MFAPEYKDLYNGNWHSEAMDKKAEYVFEISWEVCNKVGGIYTVVSSKAARMVEVYGNNYFTVGPYFEQKIHGEFYEVLPPDFLKGVFDSLKNEGITVHFGAWLINGRPNTLLIDFSEFAARKNDIKKELWDNYKIDSLNSGYFDFDEPVIWAYASGKLVHEISKKVNARIVAHAHEWLSGASVLYLKRDAKIGTVFTTHATVLGRSISSAGINLYDSLEKLNPDEECYKRGVNAKHQIEKASAQNTDVFTTVSEITGLEATYLLGRKPDVLLPNGLDLKKFPTFEQASINHARIKRKLKEFIAYYFFPYYTFKLDDCLIFFISGRYEFHDKGIDTFIDALASLNDQLKKEKSNKTVVAFFWIPANIRGIRQDLLESKTFYEDIKETISNEIEDVKTRLIFSLVNETNASCGDLFGLDILHEVERKLVKFKKKGNPPLSTHDLHFEDKDEILNAFKSRKLLNRPQDRVKVIFYPLYMNGNDRLLDINYYESIQGSHLGVFPSCYEPWGYTPLEAGALGVASVTTDLAGFGRYIQKRQKNDSGIFVIKRHNKSDQETVSQLSSVLYRFTNFTAEERVKNKIEAVNLASHADWEQMVKNYIKAHDLAVEKRVTK